MFFLRLPNYEACCVNGPLLQWESCVLLNLELECPVCKNVLHPTDDSTSFNVRFSYCRPLLYFIAGRVLENPGDAEEAVRNCFFTASRDTPEFQDEGAFRSWLLRVVIDEALLIVRRQRELNSDARASLSK